MIWRICGAYEADRDLRRDLHQDVLLAIWRALLKFRGDANIRTYIARIAHNRAISHVGREAKRPRQGEPLDAIPAEAPTLEDRTDASVRKDRLSAAVRQLPLDQRQPVTLTLEGFAPREIAEVLGISANAVSVRLTRAKQTLREHLGDES